MDHLTSGPEPDPVDEALDRGRAPDDEAGMGLTDELEFESDRDGAPLDPVVEDDTDAEGLLARQAVARPRA